MKTSATNRRLRVLLTAIRSGRLIPRPEFQRRLVWSNKHKAAFVETVLLNYPFPEIYVAAGDVDRETGEGTEMLVDGQQRITTLYEYFSGSDAIKLPRNLKRYSDLSEDDKLQFLEYEVVVRDMGSVPLDQIKDIFQRINSTNYALNAMEVQNSRFEGELKHFAEDLTEHPFFERHHVFTAGDTKRMHDVRLMLTYAITVVSTYFNRDDQFEEFLSRYNDEFPQRNRLRAETEEVLGFIDACQFGEGSRVWKKADLFSLMVELHKLMFRDKFPLTPAHVGPALAGFYEQVDEAREMSMSSAVSEYYRAALQATNDRGSRMRRGEIIRSVLELSSPRAGKRN
jgi:hypothetical protein